MMPAASLPGSRGRNVLGVVLLSLIAGAVFTYLWMSKSHDRMLKRMVLKQVEEK